MQLGPFAPNGAYGRVPSYTPNINSELRESTTSRNQGSAYNSPSIGSMYVLLTK